MKCVRNLKTLLYLLSVHVLISCTESKIKQLDATNNEGQTASAEQSIPKDSIHHFGVKDFENLENKNFTLAPLLGPFDTDLRVSIRTTKYSEENKKFAESVAKRLETVLNSQSFHDLVTSQTYHSKWDNNLTPTQIYDKLMQGKEPGRFNIEDGVIDLNLKQDNSCPSGKLGYRWTGSDTIHTYKCYIDRTRTNSDLIDITLAELGGHYIHEHLHIIGFGHDAVNPEMTSVPYRIGNIVRLLALNEIIAEGKIKNDLKFETKEIFDHQYRRFTVYQSHYAARSLEPLEGLGAYKGKTVKIRFQLFDNNAIYGAEIVN